MSSQVPFHEVRGEKEEGSYIIKLKADANKQSIFDWMSLEHSEGGSVTHDYNQSNFYHGFAARCNQELLTALRNRSDIEYIAEDAIAYVGSTTLAKGTLESDENVTGGAKAHVIAPVDLNAASLGNKVEYDTTSEESKKITQDDATWGLHRISHKGAAQKPYKYVYPESAGDGATIFVLDTGVYIEHSEFEGRASHGPSFKGDPEDKNGHGTHVAGTAIGKTYGAAKKANVISVKVHDDEGKGQSSTTIAGIDWVVFQTLFRYRKPTIMNMSFGHHVEADDVTPVDHAVNMAAALGVIPVVAAGNRGADASETSPAHAEGAFTVGAIKLSDDRADYSNYGVCVNIYAPGTHILSAGIGDPNAKAYKSGTSMSAPHASGTFALYIAELGDNIVPPVVERIVVGNSDTSNDDLKVLQVPS